MKVAILASFRTLTASISVCVAELAGISKDKVGWFASEHFEIADIPLEELPRPPPEQLEYSVGMQIKEAIKKNIAVFLRISK